MIMIPAVVAVLLAMIPDLYAWGFLGHRLTAAVAEHFLTESTRADIRNTLTSDESIVSIATWADEIKRNPRYRWTSSLHYSNPDDQEPERCSYEYRRDCPAERCVVGAIFNFTNIYDPAKDFPRSVRAEALKFLVHFVGDIHQPLHVSGRDKGGNLATVRFDGAATNLHSIWDSSMIQKRMTAKFGGKFDTYLKYLLERLSTDWRDDISEWQSCSVAESPLLVMAPGTYGGNSHSVVKGPACPDRWAVEINRFDCSAVWKDYEPGAELGKRYYEDNVLLVEKLIAMGGIRLSNVLNNLQK